MKSVLKLTNINRNSSCTYELSLSFDDGYKVITVEHFFNKLNHIMCMHLQVVQFESKIVSQYILLQ